MTNRDPALYESARIDGADWFNEFFSITVPLLRHEIGVCLTGTVILVVILPIQRLSRESSA